MSSLYDIDRYSTDYKPESYQLKSSRKQSKQNQNIADYSGGMIKKKWNCWNDKT